MRRLFLLFLFLIPVTTLAQRSGEILFTIGVSIPKGLIAQIRFYPISGIGLELHGGAVPHIGNFGGGLLLHSRVALPGALYYIGSGRIFIGRHGDTATTGILDSPFVPDRTIPRMEFAVGREFHAGSGD